MLETRIVRAEPAPCFHCSPSVLFLSVAHCLCKRVSYSESMMLWQVSGTWNDSPQKTASEFHLHRGIGLVTDVFSPTDLNNLEGDCAIGHTRYSTAGGKTQVRSPIN